MERDLSPRRAPRQQRGHQRVADILNAAEAVFGEAGYDTATVSEIAVRAGAPIGSVYQFFPNKEAIGQAVAERTSRELESVYGATLASAVVRLPLPALVDRLVDPYVHFMVARAGLMSLFEPSRGWKQLPAAIDLHNTLVRMIADLFAAQNHALTSERRALCADLTVRVVGSLAPLAISTSGSVDTRIISELKDLLLAYLELRLDP